MSKCRPPAWSRALLAWLLPAALRADVLVDMDDTHSDLVARHGDAEADRWYRVQVRASLRMALAARFDRFFGRAGGKHTFLPRGDDLMIGFVQDIRYAFRAIRMDLGFFIFAALIIGLGVGANTAVFSIMSPLLLRPLPFDDSDQLVWIAPSSSGGMSSMTSRTSNLRDFREMNRSFESMTGYNAFFDYDSYNLVGDGEPERLVGVGVARNFLEVLGVAPLYGRNFVEEESVWQGRRAGREPRTVQQDWTPPAPRWRGRR